ncbi:MAG: 1-deoxy-D-xylulose-5-phosphate reductoisomerase [Alphaproteobacteria bacterium]|nr:1-deoxy-D-xylulose-5-phosphate reductoisomerase [Alphaproteobacteria bacterium]
MFCKKISILGVTGSIGQSASDVILSAPEYFDVQVVSAGSNAQKLAQEAIRLKAKKAVIADERKCEELKSLLSGTNIEAHAGDEALEALAGEPCDLVLAAIVGFAGLRPILSALKNGINVAIANKEPLVAAGALVMETARKSGAKILPVDSEHNAIFQCLEDHNRAAIDKIILTASGGPFLDWDIKDINAATIEQAINHPNWSMGRKISVDSASMMNKALEIIEAHYLFDMPADKIDVVIHPQSVIHSMVSYHDGSVLAQMGASDMRTPVAYALSWPERIKTPGQTLDIKSLSKLTFLPPDLDKFPALRFAYTALESGQNAQITLNAANEEAVDLFLREQISFGKIAKIIENALLWADKEAPNKDIKTVDDIEEFNNNVRSFVTKSIL